MLSLARTERVWTCFNLPESSESEAPLQVKLEESYCPHTALGNFAPNLQRNQTARLWWVTRSFPEDEEHAWLAGRVGTGA